MESQSLVHPMSSPPLLRRMGGWVAQSKTLRFQIGELTLASVNLPSLTLNTHFLRSYGGAEEPILPFSAFPAETEAFFAGSYPILRRLPRIAIGKSRIRYVPAQYFRHYVDFQGSFENYAQKFSSKSRSTLRKKIRRYAEFSGGEIAWRAFSKAEMEEFHRSAFGIAENTYQARLQLGTALPPYDEFLRHLSKYADARGYILFHQERPVSYLFCPVLDNNLLYEFVGYDSNYEKWSPGTVLQYLVLESLFASREFATFDFTEGEGVHKEFFGNRSCLCADIFYFRMTPTNMAIVILHTGLFMASRGIVRLLGRLGLKAGIKKYIRSMVHRDQRG